MNQIAFRIKEEIDFYIFLKIPRNLPLNFFEIIQLYRMVFTKLVIFQKLNFLLFYKKYLIVNSLRIKIRDNVIFHKKIILTPTSQAVAVETTYLPVGSQST